MQRKRLKDATTAREKDKLQVLYWLKQEKAPTLKVIAESLGHDRNTVQSWLCKYREPGLQGMLERKKSKGRVRVIPEWAEKALEKRLKAEENGFKSYGEVQEWLAEKLGVEAKYHTVYQMTRDRLKAKLKVARPEYNQQDKKREEFKETLKENLELLSNYLKEEKNETRKIRYFAQDESRFGINTIIGRLITGCGVKPIGKWQWLFKAFWLYGAGSLLTGESFFYQFSHVNKDCYQKYLGLAE
ncbi:IS630 family transposase [Microcystis aeruginosa]|uniref:IS630 family transposase n=1 Tax=Microcystis aeruginosa TaxID=1126 RepID=UPI0018813D37|nr:IS630 family transposase [Microcystis aeruginosa]MBE8995487.1 IS630 family transposase [Microcystis aeruginosa LEGE 91341]